MAILFIDGMDYLDADHAVGVISPFLPPTKYTSYRSGGSCSINLGRVSAASQGGGNRLTFNSTGFNQQTITKRFIGSRPAYCVGFAYRKRGTTPGAPGIHIFRYEAGVATLVNPGNFDDGTNTGTALMLQLETDNTLSLYTGYGGTPNFPGTLLWNSATFYSVPNDVWIYIELAVNTTTGVWSLYIDDVLIKTQVNAIPVGIDRYSFTSFTFESHDVDDHYCTSGERLGPCRVTAFPPTFQSTHEWTPLSGTNLSQVQEFGNRPALSTPDDNSSYVESASAGVVDLFGFAKPACYGRILAVALNVDCEATLTTPTINWWIKIKTAITDLGSSPTLIGGYSIQQGIQELNPDTGTFWTDADIASTLWGYELTGTGTARVTQFCLEKLVSLRNVPFSCGQGSYSFGS